VGDALALRQALGVPGLEPQQHLAPRRMLLRDEARQVGPFGLVALVLAVRRLPLVVYDQHTGRDTVLRQRVQERAVVLFGGQLGSRALGARRQMGLRSPTAEDGPAPPARQRPR